MAYIWESETITVSEIVEALYSQYSQGNTVSVPIADGSKRFNFKKDLIPVRCSRCGNSYQTTPFLLLSMKGDMGYACSKCGNLSDEDLRKEMRLDMLKAGREQLIKDGIDPDSDDENEEEKENREQEELEKSMAEAMRLENSEIFEYERSNEALEARDAPNPETPAKPKDIPNKEIPKEGFQEEGSLKESEELNSEPNDFGEEFETVGLEEENEFENYFDSQNENSEWIIPQEVETENDDLDPLPLPILPVYPEEVEAIPVGVELSRSQIQEDQMYEDALKGIPEFESEDFPEEIEDKSYIEIKGIKYTEEELRNIIEKTLIEVKERLGFIPFGDCKYENGLLSVSCKICDNTFNIDSLDTLTGEIVTLDKNTCLKHGIKHKGDISISSCPFCKSSIFENGYNAYYRRKIEKAIENCNLHLLDAENHWFASPNDLYLLEANGVKKEINFIDLCNKYKGIDMSGHSMFAPRGDATKSEATSVENGDKGESEGVYLIPEFDTKHHYDFDAEDESLEPEFERQQKQAKSQMVFQQNDKVKKQKETIAVLDGKENPFERKEKLDAAFIKSVFYDFVKELAKVCDLKFKFEINQKTFEIPIVDFEPYAQGLPGFRLICADYNYDSMCDVPFDMISKSIPFLFNIRVSKGEKLFNYLVLYSDAVQFREKATFNALIKYINPTVLAYRGKRIQLEGNLAIQYTDYEKYLKDFTKECSPYPDGKPYNGELGILASWSSDNDIDAKDILETLSSMESNRKNDANLNKLKSDYGMYMVCSIKYIYQINKDSGRMTYIITEYTEMAGALIADGFYQCIKALLKEYYINNPAMREKSPYIMLEIDPNSFVSPSLKYYIMRNTILPVDKMYRMQFEGKNLGSFYTANFAKKHLKYCFMKKDSYRENDRDWMRRDIRKFNAKSLITMMPEEIKMAGLQIAIYNDAERFIFISKMGFVYATQLEIREYFVHQGIIQRIMLDGSTLLMPKAIDPESVYNSSGIVDSSGNNINTINSSVFNPYFRAKMDKIISGLATSEAKDFYRNFMAQKQQAAMQEFWNQNLAMQNGMGQGQGMWQGKEREAQTMTGGAYIMPNMQGMNFVQ